MGSQITDNLLQGDIPEVIEEYLELKHGVMKCIAFNRRGTLLAAGCSNGSCVIWDFETRVIAKELKDENYNAAITSVSWSKYGYHILVSTADKALILWDVAGGVKIAQTSLKLISFHAQLHPSSSIPSLCLAMPIYSAPLIVDLNTGKSIMLPVSLSESEKDSAFQFSSCFNGYGDLVYLGNSKGEILIIDHSSIQTRAVVSTPGGAGIKNIVFSKNGMFLLTNSSDRVIRIYENLLPFKDGSNALCKMSEMFNNLGGIEKLKAIGAKSLVLSHEFQESGSRTHWKVPCFSRNGEYIIGGFDSEREHKIYIWDTIGNLVKILTGPKEGLINLAWHPVHPILVSLTFTGFVYIWAKDYAENWSAFYPDFEELNRVEEYVEREDEFDLVPEMVPEIRKVKESDFNHDEEADIVTMENNSMFSDLEMSEEELCFLPSIPCSDTPDYQDVSSGDSQKLMVSNQSDSWNSKEAELDKLTINYEGNLMEGTDDCHDSTVNVTHGIRSKRQRRPTEKLLELLDQTANKAVKKMNSPNIATRNFIDW